jgi:hypothetical protein
MGIGRGSGLYVLNIALLLVYTMKALLYKISFSVKSPSLSKLFLYHGCGKRF